MDIMKNEIGFPIIFVTGASRSGTSMLSRVLGGHGQILGLNELHFFGDLCDPSRIECIAKKQDLLSLGATLFARLNRGIWHGSPNTMDFENAKRVISTISPSHRTYGHLFLAVIKKFTMESGKALACEQTPRYIFYANHLLSIFPNSYFVHLVRDPRAVLASQKNRWRQRGMGRTAAIPYIETLRVRINYHPYTMGKLWLKATLAAVKLADHPRFKILKFEDVVDNPKGEINRLCHFLGIQFESAMLDVPQMGSSHRFNRQEKGIAKDVLNRWEQTLSKGELLICEHINRSLMDIFEYKRTFEGVKIGPSMIFPFLSYPIHAAGVLLVNPRRALIQAKALFGQKNPD